MAKTKEDYFRAGYATGGVFIAAGKMQDEGYPLQTLTGQSIGVSMCGSWQAMAWKSGFDAARAEAKEGNVGEYAYMARADSLIELPSEHLPKSTHNALRSHILILLERAAAFRGTMKEKRLRRKIEILIDRHAV